MIHSEEKSSVHVSVHGVVQGVGFRQFVQSAAGRYGLTGWVRNHPDGGTVETVAEGPADSLEDFLEDIGKGPPGARVSQVDVEWITPPGHHQRFEIRH